MLKVMHCSKLTSLEGLDKYSQLAELDASSNHVEDLVALDKCSTLVNVNLSCNAIRVIPPPVMLKLVNLTSLDLSHNRISTLEIFQVA